METLRFQSESDFRDHISTVDEEGKRVWVYPKKPRGKFTNARIILSIVLITLFLVLPFVRIEGEPALLFNIIERRFIIFGSIFYPQDFHIFLLAMIAFFLFIILFTVIYGRVFCGWVCPQTIFMEMVYRRIEYWMEGDFRTQQNLDRGPLTREKFFKKSAKHILFLAVSFIIANTLLTYIIGTDQWIQILRDPFSAHISGIISILAFTALIYWIYSRFREQVCTVVCPYGRLQGVLTDKKTMMVAYDHRRGEVRGKIRKGEDRTSAMKGDCIDCNQCINVCPAGVDIRNGTQLECINCAACIDACNFMMKKTGLPQGLIRYDSEEGIAGGQSFRISPRLIGYSFILLLLMVGLGFLLLTRPALEVSVLRTPGILFQEQEENQISNLYNVKVINKTNKPMAVQLKMEGDEGNIKMVGRDLVTGKQGSAEGAFFIYLDKEDIKSMKTILYIGVYSGDKLIKIVKTTFIGPVE